MQKQDEVFNTMEVSYDMLESVLTASLQTARTYYACPEELYSLGQLEATANLVYVMLCGKGRKFSNTKLELLCQEYASIAIERMEDIAGQKIPHGGLRNSYTIKNHSLK